jgi:hypothetical protein
MFLNSRQALVNSERAPTGLAVHYLYDSSRPDVLRIQMLYPEGTQEQQVDQCLDRAESRTIETAKVYGWQSWLKVERERRHIAYRYNVDALIR